jgi:hypothetical protein
MLHPKHDISQLRNPPSTPAEKTAGVGRLDLVPETSSSNPHVGVPVT